eukprot:TRINITY_DN134_c0_g1_i1.p1 TRINITY_DN134_c0_g1~~TRINITY_DN134_c0_g1_i1.p1  ORF type:complete len:112 (+),score=11.26 TRINITY_DN134_c0_g1_i1:99-434(+)
MSGGQWEVELFDCLAEPKIFLVSLFCPLCQASYQLAGVEGHDCNIMDFLWMLFCGPCCIIKVRGDIREKYNIDGSLLMDVLMLWCCGPCAVAQQTRQLNLKGVKPAGFLMD